jgi:tRNA G18 (ribose-2'-O)-methylase SpoU
MNFAISMLGMIESLNPGTTSGIALYEISKQWWAYQVKHYHFSWWTV